MVGRSLCNLIHVSDLPHISEAGLRASLLRLDSSRREHQLSSEQCIQRAYDLIAEQLVNHGIRLTDHERRQVIPGAVLDAAVEYGWVSHHPRLRPQRTIRGRFFESSSKSSRSNSPFIRIPDAELTAQLGKLRVTSGYLNWWLGLLGGRIREWEAKGLEEAKLTEAPPEIPVRRPNATTDDQGHENSTTSLNSEGRHFEGDNMESRDAGARQLNATQTGTSTRQEPDKTGPTLVPKSISNARRRILKKFQSKRGINTVDALARSLGLSRSALYGMTTGDRNRYAEDKLKMMLKKIRCPRAKWNSPGED